MTKRIDAQATSFREVKTPIVAKVLLFVTSYFLIDHKGISGGISERYVGLHGTFVKRYSKTYRTFWYSLKDTAMRSFDRNGNVVSLVKVPMSMAIVKVLAEAKKSSKKRPLMTIIITYYYGLGNQVENLLSLLLLYVLRIAGVIDIIIDIIDPPVETHVTYNRSPSIRKIFLGTLLDILTLKIGTRIGTYIVTVSNSYKKYLTKKYSLPLPKIFVINNASFPNIIRVKPPKKSDPLTIFYSGSLLDVKDVPKLIKCINNLRNEGFEVNLLLTGDKLETENETWVKSIMLNDWFEWVKVLSNQADICVIPYPRRVHWDLTHHAKLSDYMAAGKPVVAMYGAETANILKKYNCGLVANNWKQFKQHIITLYKDREMAETLGLNGRRAVETFFNYEDRPKMLHELIQRCTKSF